MVLILFLHTQVGNGEPYTEKCDVYSFGILCWEIMSEKKPFYHVKNQENVAIIHRAIKNERPKIYDLNLNDETEFLKLLIERAWHKDPNKRPPMSSSVFNLKLYTPLSARYPQPFVWELNGYMDMNSSVVIKRKKIQDFKIFGVHKKMFSIRAYKINIAITDICQQRKQDKMINDKI